MPAWDGKTDMERFAKRIKDLEDSVQALIAAGTVIPNVDADPAAGAGQPNVWIFNDNRLRVRKRDGTIREVVTTAPGSSSSGTPQPALPAQQVTGSQIFEAAWTQTYRGNGAQRTETMLHVGNSGDSFNGIQTALIGWPYASIASALAGATISLVEVYLYTTHAYWNSGATVQFASQFNTSAPSTLTGINTGVLSTGTVKGADQNPHQDDNQRWIKVSTNFGGFLRDGTSRGMALIPGGSSYSYYAILGGVGSGIQPPRLRITYAK